MFDFLFSKFTETLAVDFGSSRLRIFVKDKGIMVNEPAVLIRDKKTKEVLSLGDAAARMIGRIPSYIEAVKPIKNGTIFDFNSSVQLLARHFETIHKSYGLFPKIPKPKTLIAVSSITPIEQKAFKDISSQAGSRKTVLVDKMKAIAFGEIFETNYSKSALVTDFGADTTQICILSANGILLSKMIKKGGNELNEVIINFIRMKYGIIVGERSAEELKKQVAKVLSQKAAGENIFSVVRGRDLESGLPRSIRISSEEISESIMPFFQNVLEVMKNVIDQSPAEIVSDIAENGIVLVGGAAKIRGLSQFLSENLSINTFVPKEPDLAAIHGTGKALSNTKLFEKIKI